MGVAARTRSCASQPRRSAPQASTTCAGWSSGRSSAAAAWTFAGGRFFTEREQERAGQEQRDDDTSSADGVDGHERESERSGRSVFAAHRHQTAHRIDVLERAA